MRPSQILTRTLLSSFMCAALAQIAFAQNKPEEQKPTVESRAGGIVTIDGKPYDERETNITLNPCIGETPGDVLGVSEKGETPQRVTAFVTKLRDPNPKARACAARQLGYLGAEAKDALPHIVRRMREEEHDGVSVNLSQALWAIGPDTKSTVAEWIESLRSDDVDVRSYAAFALGYYKPHPAHQKQVVGALAKALRDEDSGVRWMAVRGLMRLGPSAADAVPDLLAVLSDEKSTLRHLAAFALGNVGPQAEVAAPELLKAAYTTRDFALYTSATLALGRIGPAVVPLLSKDLKTNKTLIVLDVLRHLAPNGAPLIVEALGMEDKAVRGKALDIVWQFGPAAAPAVPLIVKELKGGDKDMRWKAIAALRFLGPVAKDAAPALMAALGDEDDFVKCYAAEAMGVIGPAGAQAVPQLRQMMERPVKDDRDMPQRCAAAALMSMGAETRALVPPEMAQRVKKHNAWLGDISKDTDDPTKPKPKEKKATTPPN